MPKATLKNMSGEQVGDIDLNPEVFEVSPNVPLMHQAVLAEQANGRQGTADTKTRSEVSGGGAKPFRQKGTGRARQGSSRSPQYYHGGVVFGPHPRSYEQRLPKKMRRSAIKSALSARFVEGDVLIVEEVKLDSISTKRMWQFLGGLDACGKTLMVLGELSNEVKLSTRNIADLQVRLSPAVSVRDILNAGKIIFTRAAIEKLQEVLAS